MRTKDQIAEIDKFLIEFYSTKGKKWCAERLGTKESTIRHRASVLKLRQDRGSDFFNYWQKKAAQSKIGKKRPDQAIVMKRLHLEGKIIFSDERRSNMSVKTKERIMKNGHPKGMLGKKQKDGFGKMMSDGNKSRWANMSELEKDEHAFKSIRSRKKIAVRVNCTWKSGWREIGGKRIFFRSRWEANYAMYLEWLKLRGDIISWEHEPRTFWFEGIKRGCVSYLPDFLVVKKDGKESYHEVKGWMDDRSKTKIARMSKYYPDIILIVIDSKAYKKIKDMMFRIIPGWEI